MPQLSQSVYGMTKARHHRVDPFPLKSPVVMIQGGPNAIADKVASSLFVSAQVTSFVAGLIADFRTEMKSARNEDRAKTNKMEKMEAELRNGLNDVQQS